jgi:hypothetical protein
MCIPIIGSQNLKRPYDSLVQISIMQLYTRRRFWTVDLCQFDLTYGMLSRVAYCRKVMCVSNSSRLRVRARTNKSRRISKERI